MWPFRRERKAEISDASVERWLRAQRPTFGRDGLWFFRQEELIQEALAVKGDNYVAGCLEQATEPQDEEQRLQSLTAGAVAELLGRKPVKAPPAAGPWEDTPKTMSGNVANGDIDIATPGKRTAKLFGQEATG